MFSSNLVVKTEINYIITQVDEILHDSILVIELGVGRPRIGELVCDRNLVINVTRIVRVFSSPARYVIIL
jgi:hypothetical protein